MPRYAYKPFPYQAPPELNGGAPFDAPVVIVGAGPVGLSAAIDLALHGVKSIVIDDNDVVSVGSRAICWSKRTLEIFDRLGVGERMVEKGVTWKVGRLFHKDKEVWNFDLLPEEGHKMPAFINLQQYYVEEYLVERANAFPDLIQLRFKNKMTGLHQNADRVLLDIETPDGSYQLEAAYVLACDGAKSPTRDLMGLSFTGQDFEERFLIADIEMTADFPSERWFWFEPPFHKGQSALLHRQPDNIYRIDLQLGWDADPDAEKDPETVKARIRKMVGERDFELDWVSVYSFRCARLERFVHERVIFAGDSAHVVSPFGARGGNGGIQDVDNLCWKLAAIINGNAPASLLETYDCERIHAADENILNSSRSTRFMSPKDGMEQIFRDATLALAGNHNFARQMVNSGRLSTPASYADLPHTPCGSPPSGMLRPGMLCPDAPYGNGFLLETIGGKFSLLGFGTMPAIDGLETLSLSENAVDKSGLLAERLGGKPGATYLVRPDQHIAGSFAAPDPAAIKASLAAALGN